MIFNLSIQERQNLLPQLVDWCCLGHFNERNGWIRQLLSALNHNFTDYLVVIYGVQGHLLETLREVTDNSDDLQRWLVV